MFNILNYICVEKVACKGKSRVAGLGSRSSVGTSQLAEVSTKLYVGSWLRNAISH